MKKLFLFVSAIALMLIVSGCSLFPSKDTDVAVTKKANPASENCVDRGGTLEIRDSASGGKFGVCMFSDGSECEEWAFFHGLCKPGEQQEVADSSDVTTADNSDNESTNDTEEATQESVQTVDEPVMEEDVDKAPEITTSENITVDYPTPGTQLSSPFEVTGTARVDGTTVHVDVTTLDGDPLIQQVTETRNDSGEFKQKIFYEFSSTKEGYIEVYTKDSGDKKQNIVKIPVSF